METVGTIVALLLTLMVYSYLVGDNPLFKLAEHILVGVSVGWAVVQVVSSLIFPTLDAIKNGLGNGLNGAGEAIALFIPFVLGIILLTRPLRASRPLSNIAMAFVVGTVASLSLAGALAGTLWPQIGASFLPLRNDDGDVFGLLGRLVLLVGTLVSLWYFQFTVFRSKNEATGTTTALASLSNRFRLLGRWSIMLAFGAVFAAVFLTYFAALLDRLLFIINIHF